MTPHATLGQAFGSTGENGADNQFGRQSFSNHGPTAGNYEVRVTSFHKESSMECHEIICAKINSANCIVQAFAPGLDGGRQDESLYEAAKKFLLTQFATADLQGKD